jgi:riboflavin kinase/FMN adenylyltransferase
VIRHRAGAGAAGQARVVAAGRFDGIHRGHQRILDRVLERAASLRSESAVIVERTSTEVHLENLRQQLERLREYGIDVVAFAPRAPTREAISRFGATVVVAGRHDAPAADPTVPLDVVEPVQHDGKPISSAAILTAVAAGDLSQAQAMLGRPAGVAGRVVHGFHRGRPLGIPTANLRVRGIQLPPDGVYAVYARAGGRSLRGVTNIGFNPTFGNQIRTVETHLFDFDGDLYGQRLELAFATRLRGEQKFADVAALLAQIRADIAAARDHFEHGRR